MKLKLQARKVHIYLQIGIYNLHSYLLKHFVFKYLNVNIYCYSSAPVPRLMVRTSAQF